MKPESVIIKFMRLKFIIVSDNAFTDKEDGLNIIQTFDIIKTRGFPAIHPRISVVTKWEFEPADDKKSPHKQKLIIIEGKTGNKIAETPERELTAGSEGTKSLQYINNFMGLKFDREGTYKIQVYMDEEKNKEEASFEVRLEGN